MSIGTLDGQGVATVCLCYLEISGTLWPAEQAILTDDRLRAAGGGGCLPFLRRTLTGKVLLINLN
jgi:hypothetical protein